LSYGKENSVEMVPRNFAAIFFERENVPLDGLTDVLDRIFFRFALTYASGQTWAFCDPKATFAGIKNYLPHVPTPS
jgi:hypothetical protein